MFAPIKSTQHTKFESVCNSEHISNIYQEQHYFFAICLVFQRATLLILSIAYCKCPVQHTALFMQECLLKFPNRVNKNICTLVAVQCDYN